VLNCGRERQNRARVGGNQNESEMRGETDGGGDEKMSQRKMLTIREERRRERGGMSRSRRLINKRERGTREEEGKQQTLGTAMFLCDSW